MFLRLPHDMKTWMYFLQYTCTQDKFLNLQEKMSNLQVKLS